MVSVASVSSPKQGFSGRGFISRLSASRSMPRLKVLERYSFPPLSLNTQRPCTDACKMAKRMGFSVVGLPHYTVWHLYEPSVDDIRHMEEMETERKNREKEEKERVERAKKIKEEFNDPGTQWEKDKADIEGISKKEEESKAREQGPNAKAEKDSPAHGPKDEAKGKGKEKEKGESKEGKDGESPEAKRTEG